MRLLKMCIWYYLFCGIRCLQKNVLFGILDGTIFFFIYTHNTQLLPYMFILIFNPFWILKVHYGFLLGLYKMCCFILFFSISLLLCLKSISPNDNNNCEIRNYPSWLCFNYSPKQLSLWFHFNKKNIVALKKLI